ncbi:NPCBM/NEW2 domain-containing protein [Micromonospora sp. SL1-18]|uniref:NPCBM/NEW2 domain-containing protein n=1 Tax=Micromonospora sp. SL1-18 TaxID=3399128 RepID=UPI003A4E3FF9
MRALPGRLLTTFAALVVAAAATTVTVAAESIAPRPAYALDDGLALTPPMGFNNWNTTHCSNTFNEQMVMGIADLFVAKGLKDAGYQYVNLDDCWALQTRDPATQRLVPDPARFPHGIEWLADYVHGKGLKFGIYTSAGTKTCNTLGFPGGLGHEDTDAQTFADWGVDYLKYDNCNNQGVPAIERYTKMRDALKKTGRPIVFSICEWGQNQPWRWGADMGHLWRTTGDISDNWSSMLSIMKKNAPLAEFAGPGHWNDPDMLEVGNGGMTDTEYRSHFSLWSIMAAPLLIGADLRNASQATYDILLNRDVIAVNQDRLGVQARVLSNKDGLWTFAKPLANGDVAVALFNENPYGARIGVTAAELGLPQRQGYVLRDLWQHTSTESAGEVAAHVPAHGTVMYRVSTDPDWGTYPPTTSFEAKANGPGQGSAGQYIVPGRPAEVTAELTNHGRLPAQQAAVQVTGPTSYEGVSYEGEATGNTLSGGARRSSCSGCSGGEKVGFIGNGPNNWVRVNGVTATAAGTYRLTIYAAVSGTRSLFVSVNDGASVEVPVTGTSFSSPVAVTLDVPLAAGANTIRFSNDTAYGPDLDRIVVSGTANLADWTVAPIAPHTEPVLLSGASAGGTWQVTPPADAAPGTYELEVSGSYYSHGKQYGIGGRVRLVVSATPPLATGFLSDARWLEANNGWGPVERDMSNGEQAARDGRTISIGGVQYAKGLGVHAPSDILYLAAGRCTSLVADVGIDDEKRGSKAASVTFEVWADSTKVADSGVLTWQDPAKTLTADISGASFVRLVVTEAGDGNNSDHADWAAARVTCAP